MNNTEVTLREHFEALIRTYVDTHNAVHARELNVAEDKVRALENRLQGMNEFRQALTDAQRTYATRDMLDQREESMNKRVSLLENKSANLDGKMALFALVPTGIAIASLVYAMTK